MAAPRWVIADLRFRAVRSSISQRFFASLAAFAPSIPAISVHFEYFLIRHGVLFSCERNGNESRLSEPTLRYVECDEINREILRQPAAIGISH
jgi:hypothetical protein